MRPLRKGDRVRVVDDQIGEAFVGTVSGEKPGTDVVFVTFDRPRRRVPIDVSKPWIRVERIRVMKRWTTISDRERILDYANRAYVALDGFPEFGEETRIAIRDTARMFAADDGFLLRDEVLVEVVSTLA